MTFYHMYKYNYAATGDMVKYFIVHVYKCCANLYMYEKLDGAYYGKGHQYSSHIYASTSITEMESETNSRPR